MATEEKITPDSLITNDLIALQTEIHNPPNTATNPFLKSKYAPLNEILNMVRPLCNKHGFFLSQQIGGDEGNISVTTRLIHNSGQVYTSDELIIKPDKKGIQGAGAAITYMRRYQLLSLLGIAGEDDNDGEGTSKDEVKSKPAPSKKAPASSKKPASAKKTPKSATKQSDVLPDYDTVSKESAVFRLIQEEIQERDLLLCDDNIIEVGSDMVGKQEITPGDFTVVRRKLGIEV